MADAHKLLIIGSGPAGWTAAIYAARAQLSPVVYSGVPKQDPGPVLPGGQLMLTTEVENYPGFPHGVTGPQMMADFQAQAERFGTKVIGEDILRCDFSKRPFTFTTSNDGKNETGQIRAHAVIIATGAVANWIGLPNEMRLATSGGGDTAMEEASYLTKFASTVYIIHRRDSLRASKIMQERFLSRPNAKVLWNKVVVDVLGENSIEGVMLEDTVTRERSRLDVRGLFIAIGHTPATRFLKDSGVELDASGYVALKRRDSYTNIPGVFAAGDVADANYRQAVTAAGMGCTAALDAERWLAANDVH